MRKLLFKDFLNLFDIACIYTIAWLGVRSLWFLLLVIPALILSRVGSRPFADRKIEIHVDLSEGEPEKPKKVSVPCKVKFPDEASWSKTMSNSDRNALLQAFGYIQHRLLEHPEAGIQGHVSLLRVQKWIKELA